MSMSASVKRPQPKYGYRPKLPYEYGEAYETVGVVPGDKIEDIDSQDWFALVIEPEKAYEATDGWLSGLGDAFVYGIVVWVSVTTRHISTGTIDGWSPGVIRKKSESNG